MKYCKIHPEMERRQKPNSTLYFPCPKCNSDKRREKNSTLLGQSSFYKQKEAKKGLKSKKVKFNIYSTNAWRWFSRYVLLYYADDNLTVRCSTSGEILSITSRRCHCGHYLKTREGTSTNYSVAFDFRNVAPQSLRDNRYMGGRQDKMRKWLVNRHGEEAIKELEIKKNQIYHLDKLSLDKISDEYKKKFNDLLLERGIKNPWK